MTVRDPSADGEGTHIFDCIGDTPLVELENASAGVDATIYAKLEFVNPSGSVKDRIYREMITAAEERGDLDGDTEILECSTGNAGIACTFVGTRLGYDVTIVMPEGMSEERKKCIRAYGGTLVETPGGESDVDLAMDRVDELREENPGRYWFPNQFSNADNPAAHEKTTGPEILDQLGGAPDAFVAGQGTGGTVTGVGRALVDEDPDTAIYALEPAEAPLLSCKQWGTHEIEGIGDGFVPENLDPTLMDGVVSLESQAAIDRARSLAESEGIFCGISSGANVEGCRRLAEEREDVDEIVTIICDTGHRYFTTKLFEPDHEIDVPDRDHPLDDYSKEVLAEHQDDWHIVE
ncbi:cysteine synthase family protein [Halostella sp. JP-L12]|uniref:PLP-dependent cysteine synthase family protein n=1 Tax=Halostella TaxID=1843185 RepID=UPI000EF840A9|nr:MULTISPECIES: cysteine synthase family protein [Halostella]NHN49098.1 cysteine synthase family protein [Halostella sp. JP-L12]